MRMKLKILFKETYTLSKVRIASPVSTYSYEEAMTFAGLNDSYFVPKPKPVVNDVKTQEPADKKDKKSKKEKSAKSSKSSKGAGETADLKALLPPKPEPIPEPEPSAPVFNEDEKPCFIIVDIELSEPINKKRDIEDLNKEEVLNQITQDMYEKYHQFLEENDTFTGKTIKQNFLKWLQNLGAYEIYLTSITKAATLVVTNKFKYKGSSEKNTKLYQNYIGEIFRICNDSEGNPDYWFDYAVYNLEIKSCDKAFECLQEALSKKSTHRYSLMVFGALLADKGQKEDAETCLLNLMVQEPRWLEGIIIITFGK
ncbi:hypothetical protein NQ314_020413 [Rhamnusium bicolor]|uniref:Uncharacterized protein n=1 Tax=Rhamnusium bicolor TaxID=1586634 RepID=A0AAV8WLS6_9CUCU|nr:hypothetical protein NQ314_020413 [Rhamnusium bicolor]